ncbi:MAG: hypothetical protein U0T36_09375 [Saprospiraceae bacterium]
MLTCIIILVAIGIKILSTHNVSHIADSIGSDVLITQLAYTTKYSRCTTQWQVKDVIMAKSQLCQVDKPRLLAEAKEKVTKMVESKNLMNMVNFI